MTKQHKIPASDEAWDTGELGRDESFVKQIEEDVEASVNEALDLKPISIRLEKALLEDLKHIAELHGVGYQPLVRIILRRFVDAEKKIALNEKAAAARRKGREASETDEPPKKQRTA